MPKGCKMHSKPRIDNCNLQESLTLEKSLAHLQPKFPNSVR